MTDTERINWLEQHSASIWRQDTAYGWPAISWRSLVKYRPGGSIEAFTSSLREAIDQAVFHEANPPSTGGVKWEPIR
jgi:hypothetical protein